MTMALDTKGSPPEQRRHVRFTPQEFWSLHEQGMLPQRCELVDGEILEMPAQFWPAVSVINWVDRKLASLWHDPRCIGTNGSHAFSSGWQPMPDVVVYDALPPRRPQDAAFPEPRLIVEVADETLAYDLGEKAARYAAEGVIEYWVADVQGRQLHVHREPTPDGYRERRLFVPGDEVSPLCLPEAKLPVAELLPDLYPVG
jgi:Uma2 family endonuclease